MLRHRLDYLALCVMALGAGYVAALIWIDHGNGTFARLSTIWHLMLMATVPVTASYLMRYWRWRWLLQRKGPPVPYVLGLGGYLSGLAFTATPGKAGELIRIRYFARMAVPASRTLGVFVFERASDLLIILALSLLAAPVFPTLGTLAAIVLSFICVLFGEAAWPRLNQQIMRLAERLPAQWLRHTIHFGTTVVTEVRSCLDLRAFAQSLLAGSIAWGLTSAIFVGLCMGMELQLDPRIALGIYPLAMLIGALSFVPGGVGTTELAIVLMLDRLGVPAGEAIAVAVAVAVRFVTLWYAIFIGAVCLSATELSLRKRSS